MGSSRWLRVLAGFSMLTALGLVPAVSGPAHAASTTSQSLCIGHHPQDFVWYTSSCTGHDEPEIDPLSSRAGSAQDLTWTVVLPSDGATRVDAVGPTFWIGGVVSDGPPMPAYSVQKLGNALGWGLVDDAPSALVWEIGHTSPYTKTASQFCLPGSPTKPPCYSYDVPTWDQFNPLQIKGVSFGSGPSAKSWSVVSDYGGEAEVDQYCSTYGSSSCWYPWFAYNGTDNAFTYGGDYPGTSNNYGQALQFDQTLNCPSPYGPNTTYCSTVLK